jgi:hypothetical protein
MFSNVIKRLIDRPTDRLTKAVTYCNGLWKEGMAALLMLLGIAEGLGPEVARTTVVQGAFCKISTCS